jgi:DNA-binding CsgD family transcriptional regulator
MRETEVVTHAARGRANKWIASMLGLSPATVSQHLATAMRKLGIESRVELVGILSCISLPLGGGGIEAFE